MALLSSLRYKVKFNSQGENDFAIHSSEKEAVNLSEWENLCILNCCSCL